MKGIASFNCANGLEAATILGQVFKFLSKLEQNEFQQKFKSPSLANVQSLIDTVAAKGTYLLNFDSADGALDKTFSFSSEVTKIFEAIANSRAKSFKVVFTCHASIHFPPTPIFVLKRTELKVTGVQDPAAIGKILFHFWSHRISPSRSFALPSEILRDNDPNNEAGLKNTPVEDLKKIATLCDGNPKAMEKVATILVEKKTETVQSLLAAQAGEIMNYLMKTEWESLTEDQAHVMMAISVFNQHVPTDTIAELTSHFFPGLQLKAS